MGPQAKQSKINISQQTWMDQISWPQRPKKLLIKWLNMLGGRLILILKLLRRGSLIFFCCPERNIIEQLILENYEKRKFRRLKYFQKRWHFWVWICLKNHFFRNLMFILYFQLSWKVIFYIFKSIFLFICCVFVTYVLYDSRVSSSVIFLIILAVISH